MGVVSIGLCDKVLGGSCCLLCRFLSFIPFVHPSFSAQAGLLFLLSFRAGSSLAKIVQREVRAFVSIAVCFKYSFRDAVFVLQ